MQPIDIHGFVADVRREIGPLLHESGRILYSSVDTLRPGDIYLLGVNPGGDPNQLDCENIEQSLNELPAQLTNSYVDEVWRKGQSPGGHPLQQQVRWLLSYLGYEPRSVCASNLIFVRSKDSEGAG